jgi:hypothetical protein
MKTIEKSDATDSLAKYTEHTEDFPLVITEHGQPIAAPLPVPNVGLETISLSTNPEFLALIARSRGRQEKEGGISSREMRRRLGAVPGAGAKR